MMNRILLLTKSHFKKNRGTSVGIALLLFLSALLISMALLVITDAYPTAQKESERLDIGSGMIRITNTSDGFDEDDISRLMGDDVSDYYVYRCLEFAPASVPFGDGDMTTNVLICNDAAFDKTMGRTEIVTEDTSVTGGYIYIPYQYFTSGGYEIGDTYSFEVNGTRYDLTVRGFTTTPYHGCNNTGSYEFVTDNDTYDRMLALNEATNSCTCIYYELKDGVKQSQYSIRLTNELIAIDPAALITSNQAAADVVAGRTFMSLILAVSFLTITALMALVIILMLLNSIGNYIKENMKTIGALKAIGYTSSDIRRSLIIQFLILASAGSILGVIVSFVSMPFIGSFLIAQMGIPYNVSFVLTPVVVTILSVIVFTYAVVALSVCRIRGIEPIVALRDGLQSHTFRKNRVSLDRAPFSLDISLGLKTMFFNMKQNIITFVITGIVVFICVLGLLMFENFNRNPKLSLLTLEICSGIVSVDHETSEEALEYLESRDDVSNVRWMISVLFTYNEEDMLSTNIIDDMSRLNNTDVCYAGRLPEYDNEIALSGMFAGDYGFKVGDEITLDYGDRSYTYIITGLIQTTNNKGREAIMIKDAAAHVMDLDDAPGYYWFDCDGTEKTNEILDDCSERFGDHILSKMNFYETIGGAMTTFRSLAALMLVVIVIISAAVVLLVLYLLIKTLIFNKKKDYGIYKALGYTSKDLILQTAISFMPAIIISAAVFSAVSYYTANSFMNIIMMSFGIVKCTFNIPVAGIAIIAAAIIILSFCFAIFESRRIKKIEAYELLIGE